MVLCISEDPRVRHTNSSKLSVHVFQGRSSVLLWRRYNMLCTSGFVDGVMFPVIGHTSQAMGDFTF